MYDELQFILGEGPCLDSVARARAGPGGRSGRSRDRRWPVYGPAMLAYRIRGRVRDARRRGRRIRRRAGPVPRPTRRLDAEQFAGALVAAELAGIPLLDLLDADLQAAVADPDSDAWAELNTLSRAEVSQATGMLVAQLEIEPAEALVRLRAHAYATGRSATDVARDILDRRLRLEAD